MAIVGWRCGVFVSFVPDLEWDNEPHAAQGTAVSRNGILLCLISHYTVIPYFCHVSNHKHHNVINILKKILDNNCFT